MLTKILVMAATTATLSVLPAQDWFVRAGAQGGDGSQQKPFGDPWQAFERCQAGDAVHVAEGRYFGKLGIGVWEIPFDRVQLLGGYTADFKSRDPWSHPSLLLWDKDSKNVPNTTRLSSRAKDVVIDGIAIDMRDQNEYQDAQQSGRTEKSGEAAVYLWHPATVRNCVVINPGQECLVARAGATIENNLFANAMVSCIKLNSGPEPKSVATIRNNTLLFAWDIKSPGTGNFRGAGVYLGQGANADIRGNLIGHCDNNGVHSDTPLGRSSVCGNLFAMNLFSNVMASQDGQMAAVDDKSMEMLEEVGLKACDGNECAPSGLPLDAAWMDQYSKRAASQPGKLVMDDWNKARQLLGLPMLGSGYKSATGVAPPYGFEQALQLVKGRKDQHQRGARVVPLPVAFAAAVAAAPAPAKAYAEAQLLAWCNDPATVDGKPMQMIVAISSVTNIGGIPASYDKEQHAGIMLHDPDGKGSRVTGYFKKGSNAARLIEADLGNYGGSGKPNRVYRVTGTAHSVQNIPKAAFYIDSIERYEAGATTVDAAAAARPAGRDWFVRAGAMGGDGSKDKPFRDPFQALEKCQSGDNIHVAEGEYHGKLRAGRWKIEVPYIALFGGYDAQFGERAPWAHPTRLLCPAEFKGSRGGYTIEGDADHTGAIVDGFVFDKKLNNNYDADGNLVDQFTDHSEHVRLNRPGCAVRNCIFLNGAEGALTAANGQVIENNVFLNHVSWALRLQGGHTTQPVVVRNNTFLFNWERAGRFGAGRGYGGEAIGTDSGVRAVIDNNIFEFSDNNAIRANFDPKDVQLTNNVFAHNLWAVIYRNESIVDDSNFAQLADFGFATCTGNQLLVPAIAIEPKWFDVYLQRTAYVPGKVKMDDWNQVREVLGQPLLATGGAAGKGRAPAYDWQQALAMVPKNAQCKAGARPAQLPAKFTGIARVEAQHDYQDSSWSVAKDANAWNQLDGKRVALKVAISRADNQWLLPDVKQEEYACFQVLGPEGFDGGGLPLRCYVKRGTTAERVLSGAKEQSRGKPDQLHLLKGIARSNRMLVVEVAEKTDD